MRRYYNFKVDKPISVSNLVTLEYLSLAPDFKYPKESHNFYEFAYIVSGSILCHRNGENTQLKENDFFLIKPNEDHNYSVNTDKPTSVFIVCFACKNSLLEVISGKTTIKKQDKHILSKILSEAHSAFKFPFNKKLIVNENPVFGAQQLINNAVEEILITLIRHKLLEKNEIKMVSTSEELKSNVAKDVETLLVQNVYGKITLDEISKKTFYSKTYLNKIFKKVMGSTVMDYYVALKIEESKKLLDKGCNIAAVSDKLQFDTPNYFSKVFKSKVGILPSKYKNKR